MPNIDARRGQCRNEIRKKLQRLRICSSRESHAVRTLLARKQRCHSARSTSSESAEHAPASRRDRSKRASGGRSLILAIKPVGRRRRLEFRADEPHVSRSRMAVPFIASSRSDLRGSSTERPAQHRSPGGCEKIFLEVSGDLTAARSRRILLEVAGTAQSTECVKSGTSIQPRTIKQALSSVSSSFTEPIVSIGPAGGTTYRTAWRSMR